MTVAVPLTTALSNWNTIVCAGPNLGSVVGLVAINDRFRSNTPAAPCVLRDTAPTSVGAAGPEESPNASTVPDWLAAYTTPLATITLCQCVPPLRVALHNWVPVSASSARAVLPPMRNTMLLAITGEVPLWPLCHTDVKDGLPPLSKSTRRPDAPLPLTTKTHVLPSAGLTQTAGWLNTRPP